MCGTGEAGIRNSRQITPTPNNAPARVTRLSDNGKDPTCLPPGVEPPPQWLSYLLTGGWSRNGMCWRSLRDARQWHRVSERDCYLELGCALLEEEIVIPFSKDTYRQMWSSSSQPICTADSLCQSLDRLGTLPFCPDSLSQVMDCKACGCVCRSRYTFAPLRRRNSEAREDNSPQSCPEVVSVFCWSPYGAIIQEE